MIDKHKMDKPENIPSGANCTGETFTCPWLYDMFNCELVTWDTESDCGGRRLPACLAAYPNGATMTIMPKEKE